MSEVANNSSAPVLTALNICNAVNLEKIFACVNFDSTKINVKKFHFFAFPKVPSTCQSESKFSLHSACCCFSTDQCET